MILIHSLPLIYAIDAVGLNAYTDYAVGLISCNWIYRFNPVWLIQGGLNESVTLNDWFCVIDSVGLIQIVIMCLIVCFIIWMILWDWFHMTDSVWLNL